MVVDSIVDRSLTLLATMRLSRRVAFVARGKPMLPPTVACRSFLPLAGQMSEQPLLIPYLLEHAAKWHGDSEIVSRSIDEPDKLCRTTWGEVSGRAMQLANALKRLDVQPGDRVATLAFSSHRHLELYYAIPGFGAVCHTINPRLHAAQLHFILNDAQDKVLFMDAPFLGALQAAAAVGPLPHLRAVVVMTGRPHMPPGVPPGVPSCQLSLGGRSVPLMCYEELVQGEAAAFAWRFDLDERAASSMCYTSGTTGLPKGCLFSHRSTLLHTFGAASADGFGVTHMDSVLSIVPMFHVNGWGLPYAAAMVGAKLVFPGSRLDGKSVFELLKQEECTVSAGVPTVWLMLLDHLAKLKKAQEEEAFKAAVSEGHGKAVTPRLLPHLERLVIGGSAAPPSMVAAFEEVHGVACRLSWGMTELSPCGVVGSLKRHMKGWAPKDTLPFRLKPGRAMFGVDMRVVANGDGEIGTLGGANGTGLSSGLTVGRLEVKGPAVIQRYWNAPTDAVDSQGWFDTGDVGTLDTEGYLGIVDRAKDVIKSGGEWISSIELENVALGHPDVDSSEGPGAAALAMSHPKWGERPLLFVRLKKGSKLTPDQLRAFMEAKGVAKFMLPDDVVFLSGALPLQGTGKVWKMQLRNRIAQGEFSAQLLSK